MKGLIISLCVIAVILGLVIANSLYTLNVTDTLISKTNKLDSGSYTFMAELLNYWKKQAPIIGLSSSTKETDKIEDILATLDAMYKSNNFLGLEEKKALLTNYIKLIRTHEMVTIENIL